MTDDERWQKCEPGTIQNVVASEKQAEQTRQLNRRAMLTGTVGTVAGCTLLLIRSLGDDEPLTCSQVGEFARDYTLGVLPEKETTLVDNHRKICDHCDQYLTKLSRRSVS